MMSHNIKADMSVSCHFLCVRQISLQIQLLDVGCFAQCLLAACKNGGCGPSAATCKKAVRLSEVCLHVCKTHEL